MKILHIHNRYRFVGGEDRMFEALCELLTARGHEVVTYARSSDGLAGWRAKLAAFREGGYSREALAGIAAFLDNRRSAGDRFDIAHVHNLFPRISPLFIQACATRGIPAVMRAPNCRFTCPTGAHVRRGRLCELCSGGREHWCLITNCRGRILESAAYAWRAAAARRRRLYIEHLACVIPPSVFLRNRLIDNGFRPERIAVIPNTVAIPAEPASPAQGDCVAYVGRLGEEKGVIPLIEAARRLPRIPFRFAGDGPLANALAEQAPANVEFLGRLDAAGVCALYARARLVAVPSVCYEGFGLAAAEALAHGVPVVASQIGGLPEIVDDGVSGRLVTPGAVDALADAMAELWDAPALLREMGSEGRAKALREYTADVYYARLMAVYARVVGEGPPATAGVRP